MHGKNAHNLYSVTRSHFVAKLSVNDHREAPGHLTSRDELWGFLEFKSLLIHKVRFVGYNPVGIHGTAGFVEAWVLHLVAGSGDHSACEPTLHIEGLLVATVVAPDYDSGAFDHCLACGSDDAGYHDQLAHQSALQITQHSWQLI